MRPGSPGIRPECNGNFACTKISEVVLVQGLKSPRYWPFWLSKYNCFIPLRCHHDHLGDLHPIGCVFSYRRLVVEQTCHDYKRRFSCTECVRHRASIIRVTFSRLNRAPQPIAHKAQMEIDRSIKTSDCYKSIATLCLFGIASVVALKYP